MGVWSLPYSAPGILIRTQVSTERGVGLCPAASGSFLAPSLLSWKGGPGGARGPDSTLYARPTLLPIWPVSLQTCWEGSEGLGKCLPQLSNCGWHRARPSWPFGVWGSHSTGFWVPGREEIRTPGRNPAPQDKGPFLTCTEASWGFGSPSAL